MHPFHARVARVGLDAICRFGFVLAGGYAVQLHDIGLRPSNDIDLFTDEEDPEKFHRAVTLAVSSWEADGLTVRLAKESGTFARLHVSDGSQEMQVDLCHDWRKDPPVAFDIGPVLSRDDSVANKVLTAFGRFYARDLIDVYNALTVGGYTTHQLLDLAAERDRGFDRRHFADSLRSGVSRRDSDYAQYDFAGADLEHLRSTLAAWADEIG